MRFLQKETEDVYEMSVERLRLALQERDTVAAERVLERLYAQDEDAFSARAVGETKFNRAYFEGLVARMKGDTASAAPPLVRRALQQEKVGSRAAR